MNYKMSVLETIRVSDLYTAPDTLVHYERKKHHNENRFSEDVSQYLLTYWLNKWKLSNWVNLISLLK